MSPAAHRLVALLLLLLLVASVYVFIDRIWLGRYQLYQQAQSDLQDQLHRYERLLATREPLEAQLRQIRQERAADEYYLPRTTPTLAATALQQQISQLVQGNGGSLASSQILPAQEEQDRFVRVAVRVQLTGDAETLQRLLYSLESAEPLLFVDNLQVRSRTVRERVRGATRADQRIRTVTQLIIQADVAGYMQLS